MKYQSSDRLVATGPAACLQSSTSNSWEFCDLSDCHWGFVKSSLNLWHLDSFLPTLSLFYTTNDSSVSFLTLFKLTENLMQSYKAFCRAACNFSLSHLGGLWWCNLFLNLQAEGRRFKDSMLSSVFVNPKCVTKEYSHLFKLRLREDSFQTNARMAKWVIESWTEKISHDWFVNWLGVTQICQCSQEGIDCLSRKKCESTSRNTALRSIANDSDFLTLTGLPGRVTLSAGVTFCHVNNLRWGNPPSRGWVHVTFASAPNHQKWQ